MDHFPSLIDQALSPQMPWLDSEEIRANGAATKDAEPWIIYKLTHPVLCTSKHIQVHGWVQFYMTDDVPCMTISRMLCLGTLFRHNSRTSTGQQAAFNAVQIKWPQALKWPSLQRYRSVMLFTDLITINLGRFNMATGKSNIHQAAIDSWE